MLCSLPFQQLSAICSLCAGRSHQVCSLLLSGMCFLAVIHSTGPDVIRADSVNVVPCLKVNIQQSATLSCMGEQSPSRDLE